MVHRNKTYFFLILLQLLGLVGGDRYTHHGGGINYLCLPHTPKYDKYKDKWQTSGKMYGTEYVSVVSIRLRKTFMTTMLLAPSVTSNHVVQPLWCPHGMIDYLAAPRSIMGTLWLKRIQTRSNSTTSALTKTQSMSLVPRETRLGRHCTHVPFICKFSRADLCCVFQVTGKQLS